MESFNIDSLCHGDSDDTDIEEDLEDVEDVEDNDDDEGIEKEVLEIDFDAGPSEIRVRLPVSYYIFKYNLFL